MAQQDSAWRPAMVENYAQHQNPQAALVARLVQLLQGAQGGKTFGQGMDETGGDPFSQAGAAAARMHMQQFNPQAAQPGDLLPDAGAVEGQGSDLRDQLLQRFQPAVAPTSRDALRRHMQRGQRRVAMPGAQHGNVLPSRQLRMGQPIAAHGAAQKRPAHLSRPY